MSDRTHRFRVEGMTCASCVRRVERALAGVPGVSSVSVNLATEEAAVAAEGVRTERLAEALAARGYRLALPDSSGPEAKRQAARFRVIAAWVLTLPLMAGMLPVAAFHLPWPLQAVLSAGAAFGAGWPFFARAFRQARVGEASMDTLIALGSGVAWGFALHEGWRGAPHPPFESAAALVAFLSVGKYLEARVKHRATGALEELLRLAPDTALRLREGDDGEESVPTRLLQPGDRVRVRPGTAVPVDGRILEGRADAVEALLTGEPMPVPKGPGDAILAGTVIHSGALVVRVEAAGRATWLARLGAQVAEAQGSRAPIQDLADRVSARFVPAILLLAALTFAAWWIRTGGPDTAWRPAVTLLVIACPCALGLATPVAVAAAIGSSARRGLLVRDASALEALARSTDLVLDKTGTLTKGRPELQALHPLGTVPPERLLAIAAALERDSEHPLARGLREAARDLPRLELEDFRAFAGDGVSGRLEGCAFRLGRPGWLGIEVPDLPPGASAVALADETGALGLFVMADPLRPEAPAVLDALMREGLRIHLLSGDRPEAAQAMAARLGIASAEGGCTPETKRHRVQELQSRGRVVAFAGDGVNDAPALAQADAGISLPGLEATRAAAPLNLLREGLEPLREARRLALLARRIVVQNLLWAFAYNLLLVPLAAFNLLDRWGGPALAGAAMGLSSVTVVLNALRLRRS